MKYKAEWKRLSPFPVVVKVAKTAKRDDRH